MSLGRIVIFVAGATAGALACYAAKSEKFRPAAVSAVKTGLKAKDWTVKQYDSIKEDVKSLAEEAREKGSALISKEANETAGGKLVSTLARLALFGAIGTLLFLPLVAKRKHRHRHRYGSPALVRSGGGGKGRK